MRQKTYRAILSSRRTCRWVRIHNKRVRTSKKSPVPDGNRAGSASQTVSRYMHAAKGKFEGGKKRFRGTMERMDASFGRFELRSRVRRVLVKSIHVGVVREPGCVRSYERWMSRSGATALTLHPTVSGRVLPAISTRTLVIFEPGVVCHSKWKYW